MKVRILYFVMIILFWNCQEKPKTTKPKVEDNIAKENVTLPVPQLMVELGKFADFVITDISDVHQLVHFKQIDLNQSVTTINMNTAVALYRKMIKGEKVFAWPIFELKGGDTVILPVEGIGFGGPIWAKVLVDRKTMEIKNIEFEHSSESEGYGAAMTQSHFEDKFTNTKIDLEKNTFTLQANLETRMDGGTIIDGISGATMTSEAALEMVNLGLTNYKGYLRP